LTRQKKKFLTRQIGADYGTIKKFSFGTKISEAEAKDMADIHPDPNSLELLSKAGLNDAFLRKLGVISTKQKFSFSTKISEAEIVKLETISSAICTLFVGSENVGG